VSYQLVDTVFYFGSSPTEKAVLLALCKHANRDGTNSFASVATIADETALSERTVQRALRALEKRKYGEGYIMAVSGKKGGRKGLTVNYKILLPLDDIAEAVKRKQTGDTQSPLETDGCQSDTPTGDTQSGRVTDSHPTGDTVTPESVLESVRESVLGESVQPTNGEGSVLPTDCKVSPQDIAELRPVFHRMRKVWEDYYLEYLPNEFPRVHKNQVNAWAEQGKKFQQFADADYTLLKGILANESEEQLMKRFGRFINKKEQSEKDWFNVKFPFRIFARQ
jgi:DNA-binding Lrp family transcriptional regulator